MKTNRRNFLVLTAALALSACGGGDPVQAPLFVAFYGDSLTAGSVDDKFLPVRPVARMTALAKGAFTGIDMSYPGTSVWAARDGLAVYPTEKFSESIKKSPAKIIVIRYMASALERPENVEDYKLVLNSMVSQVRQVGKIPILVGSHWFTIPPDRYGVPLVTVQKAIDTFTLFHNATEQVANTSNTLFIDTRKVPFYGAFDIVDIIHPTQEYSDRMSEFIVRNIIESL